MPKKKGKGRKSRFIKWKSIFRRLSVIRQNQKQSQGMVDIGSKDVTRRVARASATIKMGKKAFTLLISRGSPKGDVFETAKVAGVMAAKATPQFIPMCHPLELSKVSISFKSDAKKYLITVISEVQCLGRTGVEMEALTAVTIAALTMYDMMKWADKGMVITDTKLLFKSGGKSGEFHRA